MQSKKRSQILRMLALASLSLSALSAHAMPELDYLALPHLGFGGEALSVHNDGEIFVGGWVENSQGHKFASKWEGPTYDALQILPMGTGTDAEVEDVTSDPTSNLFRGVGCVLFPSGIWRGILWRELPGGAIQSDLIPTNGDGGNQTFARVENTLPLIQGIRAFTCGAGRYGGVWKAEVNTQLITEFGMPVIMLPSLGGAGSYAKDIALYDGFEGKGVTVVGSAQNASGQWRACSWTVVENALGTGWNVTVDDDHVPGSTSSELRSITGPELNRGAAGNALFGGTLGLGVKADGYAPGEAGHSVITLAESHFTNPFNRSSAHGAQRSHSGLWTVGENHRDTGPMFGTIGFSWQEPSSDQQNCYRAEDMCSPGSAPVIRSMNGISRDDVGNKWQYVGSAWSSFPNTIVPCILVGSDCHMADRVYQESDPRIKRRQDETLLWWNDNRWLTSRVNRREPSAWITEMQCYNLGDTLTHEVGHWVGIVRTLGAGSSANVVVKALRVSTQEWEVVGTFSVGDSPQTISLDIPTSVYVDNDTRYARFQVHFTPGAITPRAYGINQVEYMD